MPVLLYKLYGARTILNTIIQSLTPHNSMLNMSLVKHSVTEGEERVRERMMRVGEGRKDGEGKGRVRERMVRVGREDRMVRVRGG